MKWNPFFHGFIRHLYYSRITVTGSEHIPAEGPLLVLCLHRNGAVDAFVYREAVPRLTYMVKAGLRRSFFGRLFFSGVEVVRSSDGGQRRDNLEAIGTCVRHLQGGERFAIFPEGTSKLGPSHLPFKSGAARIALRYLDGGGPLTVLPLGIHYECPWAFRSRVEVVVGEPIPLELPAQAASRGARLKEIKRRFSAALEAVGLNVPDKEYLDLAQKFAYIATLGTGHRYFDALKSMERRLPPEALTAWNRMEASVKGRWVLRHQGVPLFPLRMPWAYALLTLLLAGPVLAGALLNLPPLALAFWAGRRFPDDTNVIALWRILTGVPLLILWAAAWGVVAVALGNAWLAVVYLALTWLAARGWYRLKKLAVVAWNGLFHPGLRADALALHQSVLTELQSTHHDESTAAGTPAT